jgi:hypothetical protein
VTAAGDPELTAAELETEAEDHCQAAYEAMYGTPEEQAADVAVDQAEAIVSGAFGGYLTGPYLIPNPDDPEAPEPEAGP